MPTEERGATRTGTVKVDGTCLDMEGREWLKAALEEFRGNPKWDWPMSAALARAAIHGVLGDAPSDETND